VLRKSALRASCCYHNQAMSADVLLAVILLRRTIVSTSAPRIGRALGVSLAGVGLVVTAYLVPLAVLIPMSGWLVNRLEVRRVSSAGVGPRSAVRRPGLEGGQTVCAWSGLP
jgi:MFS family permease